MLQPEVITEQMDLRHLSWSRTRESSGTAGSYLKAYEELGGKKIYYKLSCFDPMKGIIGHESINELICARLLSILGIEHLSYQLIHADVVVENKEYETWLCASEDFKERGESKIALDDLYELERYEEESPFDFCMRMGWEQYLNEMLLVDYLILNRDRHGANIEILRDAARHNLRPAPLFDQGISLVYSCYNDEALERFDILGDLPVQCFVGGRSTWENLGLITEDVTKRIRPLDERDQVLLFRDLDTALAENYRDKIWQMIWKRWQKYEDFLNRK